MRKNGSSILFIALAILVVVIAIANCGGGGKSPTEPPLPTPTPAPTQPSISFTTATPDCGATIPRGGSVKVRVYIVANSGNYVVEIGLFDASGNRVGDSVTQGLITGTGFYDLTLSGPHGGSATTATMELILHPDTGSNQLASQTLQCGFIWQ